MIEKKMRFYEAFFHVMLEKKSNLQELCFGAETKENLL
jgi:hypothetical protein